MKQSSTTLALLVFPMLLGCGQHIGLDIDSLSAAREHDDRVVVSAGLRVRVTGESSEADTIDEVCVVADWAEESLPDAGGGAGDAGADGGSASIATSDGGTVSFNPQGSPRPTGPALFSARSCTQERFQDGEVKVLTVRSAEAIPAKPLLITISVTASAPSARLPLIVRDYMGNQISSP